MRFLLLLLLLSGVAHSDEIRVYFNNQCSLPTKLLIDAGGPFGGLEWNVNANSQNWLDIGGNHVIIKQYNNGKTKASINVTQYDSWYKMTFYGIDISAGFDLPMTLTLKDDPQLGSVSCNTPTCFGTTNNQVKEKDEYDGSFTLTLGCPLTTNVTFINSCNITVNPFVATDCSPCGDTYCQTPIMLPNTMASHQFCGTNVHIKYGNNGKTIGFIQMNPYVIPNMAKYEVYTGFGFDGGMAIIPWDNLSLPTAGCDKANCMTDGISTTSVTTAYQGQFYVAFLCIL